MMQRITDSLLSILIPGSILLHLLLAPYTKVEESFNVQATHDILTYGVPWLQWDINYANLFIREHYDHITFTGPVPRTFVGPLTLAGASLPFVRMLEAWGGIINGQLIVRAVLGLFNAFCMIQFRDGVAKSFGRNAANWYTVFQASQFHMMYYASRTLPNFFAFGTVTLATANLLPYAGRRPTSKKTRRRNKVALTLLTMAGVIFRSEIALLLASYTVYFYLHPNIGLPLRSIIPAGVLGLVIGLALTVPIDSFFWQRFWIWPELTGFIYNIVNRQSVNWGIQPWHFYFTDALPRVLFNRLIILVCLPFTLSIPILRRPALDILIPNLLFIAIYSFQPHKEWRFIIYTIPPINAIAAAGASWIWTRRAKSFAYRVLSLALVVSTLGAFAASGLSLAVSRLNYPGAEALNRLHSLVSNDTGVVKVHMDTLACMTGVTRFMERPPPVLTAANEKAFWVYDKEENEQRLLDPLFWEGMDYVIAEAPERVIGRWEILDTIGAYAGWKLLRPGDEVKEVADWRKIKKTCQKAIHDIREHNGPDGLWRCASLSYAKLEALVRVRITQGWWVKIEMEPRLRVLRKEKGVLIDPVMG
ncbi:hypothetical protein N7G274_005726 [Stereocaulon virgatum]|uniref:Mannosyltransferase n=1 Tax=Stereocaulon virgatum TaxID=373712 RepID=A0ABR4A9C6_9LECA